MNHEIEPSLLISLVILIAVIGFIIWWYGIRKDKSTNKILFKSPGHKDKLTLINGIGPTLETKLNRLGITSFKQISELTRQDIERVNQVLDFKGRIEREGWVVQAKKLVQAGSRSTTPSWQRTKKVARQPIRKTSKKKKKASKKTTKKSTKKTSRRKKR